MPDLSQVIPSLAAGLGVVGFDAHLAPAELQCPDVQHAVICLVDGLGARLLQAHADHAPFLAAGRREEIDSVFPTTTPSALASLGTGELPGTHGLVGASFLLPDTGRVLAPLSWGDDPSPVAVQPERTMFERLGAAGVTVRTLSATAYQRSGLTRSVLRGAQYIAVDGIDQQLQALADPWPSSASLTYVYLPDLDRTGHEFGAGSPRWCAVLREADRLVQGIVERMPRDAALVVTADHGMVNCPSEDRVAIEDDPALRADVDVIAGEPRARHLYVRTGAMDDVARRWRDRLGSRASVYTRDQLIDSGLLGDVADFVAERIGDVVVVAEGTLSLTSSVDARVSALTGQHGALTGEERAVPAIWFDTVR